ncbi:hypothetical protein JHK82_038848 [Glycine max]|uniref:Disease resistance protein RGA5 isoform A n=1 Tax=Glycine soja TaxID=3848 RepID=A0A0B2SIB2_GLYSO|nr:heavy metal-associated isoprenylated plant protein 47-like isoform X2 [Glycine soja]KAG4953225.1 hypothetical protein JHK87_038819 [Glycine soja]KAG5109625.1 hypothetical protein JHK82_038848 [Glycine max]KHN44735.1 hypothetical protein glysoja_032074 [Glycine soja]RZB67533.1 Disease resistance protein RGA5 isoform A [Glycine soja]
MKQKIVIRMHVEDGKCRSKALKIAAVCQGVQSLAFEGETSDQLVVTGEGIDAVFLTNRMRKKFSYATLLSVEEVKEEKDEGGQDGGEEEDETETNENYPPPCPMCGTYHSPMYHHVVYDPYPNSCSIL